MRQRCLRRRRGFLPSRRRQRCVRRKLASPSGLWVQSLSLSFPLPRRTAPFLLPRIALYPQSAWWRGCGGLLGGGGCAVLGTVVCDALMRHCLSDEFEVQHECKLQCPHTFIEVDFGCRLKALPTCTSSAAHLVGLNHTRMHLHLCNLPHISPVSYTHLTLPTKA